MTEPKQTPVQAQAATLTLRTVPAKEGWAWVRDGFRLLIANPVPIHLALMFLFASLLLSSALPIVGAVLPALLMPVLYLGLMNVIAATRAADLSPTPEAARAQTKRAFTGMVTVFQDTANVRRLMLLGAAYALGVLAIMGLSALFDGGFMFAHMVLGEALPNTDESKQKMLEGMFALLPLYAPISLVFWFAPQLVGLHGHGIVKALFFSGLGCWRNLKAFAVYALVWVAVFIATQIVLFAALALLGKTLGIAVAMIASIFLVTWLYCSFFASYVSLVQVTQPEARAE